MTRSSLPRIIPTNCKNLSKIASAASKAGKSILVTRHPRDGGPSDWHGPSCQVIIADLSVAECQAKAHEFLNQSCDVLVFSIAHDRNPDTFTYGPFETHLVSDLFRRSAGAAGKLAYLA